MPDNQMARMIRHLDKVPALLRTRARSMMMGRMVKFVGTAGLSIEELTKTRAVVSIRNRTPVQNHIGGIHAAAMALIAETASGFVVGMNVPDDRVPVIKTMKIEFVKRTRGALRAVAELTQEQQASIVSTDKGQVTPRVIVTDEDNKEPIVCEMVWAWTPRRR